MDGPKCGRSKESRILRCGMTKRCLRTIFSPTVRHSGSTPHTATVQRPVTLLSYLSPVAAETRHALPLIRTVDSSPILRRAIRKSQPASTPSSPYPTGVQKCVAQGLCQCSTYSDKSIACFVLSTDHDLKRPRKLCPSRRLPLTGAMLPFTS